jgi:putative DNA primase/helicase
MTDDNILRLAAVQEKERATESENDVARILAEIHKGRLLYDHTQGAWFQWDGAHWRREETALALDLARELAERAAASKAANARSFGRASFASGAERLARVDRAFAVTSEKWDRDPFLLGTPGGTVDLRTGELRDAKPGDYISKITAIAPADTADCARWLAFLEEATGGDLALIRFLQQWFGYCLTGDVREHALLFCCGPGKNGKTTMLNAVGGILGDYAVTASMDVFTASQHERHPTDLAMLRGARLVTAAETEEGRSWAESRIKQITGGDPITARFMRQDFFTYQPQFKLTIIGNHTPNLRNIDEATRRRFNIVPFTRQPKRPDKALGDKLRKEWPGILRWMINGCLDWQVNELTPAPTVITATADYFAGQDMIGQWLEDMCDAEPGNEFKSESSRILFKSWADYARDAGENPGSRKGFAATLERRGFVRGRAGKEGNRIWKGIRLKSTSSDDF